MKSVKTRFRSRLFNKMLEGIMHVCINGPASSNDVVARSVAHWLDEKKRRKLKCGPTTATESTESSATIQTSQTDAGTQTDRPEDMSAVEAALQLDTDDLEPDSDSDL